MLVLGTVKAGFEVVNIFANDHSSSRSKLTISLPSAKKLNAAESGGLPRA